MKSIYENQTRVFNNEIYSFIGWSKTKKSAEGHIKKLLKHWRDVKITKFGNRYKVWVVK